MKTNSKYTEEELLHSLVDFADGKELEEDLKREIGNRIAQDGSFRKQYEEIRNALNFLSEAKFSGPPEHYFNNLPVRINEKLQAPAPQGFWERLSPVWKILIPAIPVIAALLVFLFTRDDRIEKTLAIDTGRKAVEETIRNEPPAETPTAKIDEEEDTADTQTEEPVLRKKQTVLSHEYYEYESGQTEINRSGLFDNPVADNIDEEGSDIQDESSILLNATENEETAEDEFMELTPEQQAEILNILKNS
ncbi:MAG: hypothetical protein K1X85_02110 [Ignavibacteria bacterium]|nr:hypothetical protein [Ignavibacteria bacterium]